MNSPYFNGGGGGANFGPPPGLAAILAQRDEALQKAGDQIGSFAGGIGGGIAGAAQGAADPGVFGDGTSSASGAGQGFLRNFAVGSGQASGGGGGGGMSGFASLVNGGGNGGGGGMPNLGGMTVKQLQAAGKTADAFRNQMAAGTPTTGDEDPKILGTTADEWSTLGAQDKWGKVSGYVQAQAQKSVMQQMAAAGLQNQQMRQQLGASQDFGNAWKMAANNVNTAALAQRNPAPPSGSVLGDYANLASSLGPGQTGGPVMGRTPTMDDFVSAATNYYPNAMSAREAIPIVDHLAGRWHDKATGMDAPNATWRQDPITGRRFLQVGKQVLPSGDDPATAPQPVATDLPDKDGNPTGTQIVVDRKGGIKIVRPQATGALQPVIDPISNLPIPGMGVDASGKYHDVRTLMDKLGMSTNAPAASVAPAAPPSAPKSFKSGHFYGGKKYMGGDPKDPRSWQ